MNAQVEAVEKLLTDLDGHPISSVVAQNGNKFYIWRVGHKVLMVQEYPNADGVEVFVPICTANDMGVLMDKIREYCERPRCEHKGGQSLVRAEQQYNVIKCHVCGEEFTQVD